ncbi:hypothetical protein CEXT_155991 [Caerostris extrusa]|uniref:Uncharacterized protein n=1 Tax=Caerostris extrusa TaxID=172846 RepID=A0AAV4Q9F9_CAEEX|nr:hypothetical protein CEXT_155991 [Caerostris extrusa]
MEGDISLAENPVSSEKLEAEKKKFLLSFTFTYTRTLARPNLWTSGVALEYSQAKPNRKLRVSGRIERLKERATIPALSFNVF